MKILAEIAIKILIEAILKSGIPPAGASIPLVPLKKVELKKKIRI